MSKLVRKLEDEYEAPIDLIIIQELEDVDDGLTMKQLARCIDPTVKARQLSHEVTKMVDRGDLERCGGNRRVRLTERALEP